jgi:hypothetical protein
MKLNIELDFADLEFDEGNVTDLLKHSIVNDTIHKLKSEINEKTMTAISSAVRTSIETQMNTIIAEKIKSVLETNQIKKQYGSEPITFDSYVSDVFQKSDLRKNIDNHIEKCCKVYVEEIKKTYDMAFASHIVKNMAANNLLNQDVANLLIK